jgi:hypothetical protein
MIRSATGAAHNSRQTAEKMRIGLGTVKNANNPMNKDMMNLVI